MKSVGEAMALGRNFTEALQKALRSLESASAVFDWSVAPEDLDAGELLQSARRPHDGRLREVQQALWAGATPAAVHAATAIDPWFIAQLQLLNDVATMLGEAAELDPDLLLLAKRHGFSDAQIGAIRGLSEPVVRGVRQALGIRPVYKTVDTCAAEFAARTPYHYSSYDLETEVVPRERPAVLILGSGPNRIGQGIEFDYSCVHAALTLSQAGFRDRHGQLQPGDRVHRLRHLRPALLRAADRRGRAGDRARRAAGGTGAGRGLPVGRADAAAPGCRAQGERGAAAGHLAGGHRPGRGAAPSAGCSPPPGCRRPKHGTAISFEEAKAIADEIGYPVLVRPSHVLGGRGMEIVYDESMLGAYLQRATEVNPDHRCWWTASWTTRSRSTWTPCSTAPSSTWAR